MIECYDLFPSTVWKGYCEEIDNFLLEEKIYKFSKKEKSTQVSNIGGYQGHNFFDMNLFDSIKKRIPQRKDKPFSSIDIDAWININKKGDYNKRHIHFDSQLFLSGVYYVKVPEKSGDIRFYNPRGCMSDATFDHYYFNDGHAYQALSPKEGMILFFPTWLEHDVEENLSNENRISVSFNVIVKHK